MNEFHRIHGYGDGLKYDLFVLMMDLTSLAMIVFALSGVYLWLKLVRYKWLGWLLLLLRLAYTAGVIGVLME